MERFHPPQLNGQVLLFKWIRLGELNTLLSKYAVIILIIVAHT